MALPNSINYSDIPDALKSVVTSTTIVITPVLIVKQLMIVGILLFSIILRLEDLSTLNQFIYLIR